MTYNMSSDALNPTPLLLPVAHSAKKLYNDRTSTPQFLTSRITVDSTD